MKKYISILRGINVSGQKKILMTDLKNLYESIGYKNVETYIQSGNVIFEANEKDSEIEIASKIEVAILKLYSFEVPVIVFKNSKLKQWIESNPFLKDESLEERLYFTFLNKIPDTLLVEQIRGDYLPEKFEVRDKVVYFYCQIGYGKTKLSNTFFEKKLKVKATTRNFKTTFKLLKLSLEF